MRLLCKHVRVVVIRHSLTLFSIQASQRKVMISLEHIRGGITACLDSEDVLRLVTILPKKRPSIREKCVISMLCCSGLDSELRTFQQGQSQPPGCNSRAKSDNLVLRSTLMAQITVRTKHFLIKTKYTPSAWIITSLLPKYQLVAKTTVSHKM